MSASFGDSHDQDSLAFIIETTNGFEIRLGYSKMVLDLVYTHCWKRSVGLTLRVLTVFNEWSKAPTDIANNPKCSGFEFKSGKFEFSITVFFIFGTCVSP